MLKTAFTSERRLFIGVLLTFVAVALLAAFFLKDLMLPIEPEENATPSRRSDPEA